MGKHCIIDVHMNLLFTIIKTFRLFRIITIVIPHLIILQHLCTNVSQTRACVTNMLLQICRESVIAMMLWGTGIHTYNMTVHVTYDNVCSILGVSCSNPVQYYNIIYG